MINKMLPELASLLSHVTAKVDSLVRSRLESVPPPHGPILQRYLIGRGKRLRSFLLYLCFLDLGGEGRALGDEELACKLGALLELMHNYSLIHDDIIDGDRTRRGLLCIHVEAGTGAAVLLGDVLLRESFRFLLEIDSQAISRTFFDAAARTQEGQVLELALARDAATSVEDYLRMIRLKTGVFFAASCRLGALAAGASDDVQERCARIGLDLGTLYQLRDDLDDLGGPGERNAYEARDGWHETLERLEREYHVKLERELSGDGAFPSLRLYLRHLDVMMGFPREVELEAVRS